MAEETVGPTRSYVRSNDGLQPGDPAKAAAAIVAALDADDPPLRLVLGADAIGNSARRLCLLTDELEAWRLVAIGPRASPQNVGCHMGERNLRGVDETSLMCMPGGWSLPSLADRTRSTPPTPELNA